MKRTTTRIHAVPALGGVAALLLAAACGDGASRAPAAPVPGRAPAALAAASSCMTTAAHPAHALYACSTCHACLGVVAFDPAGPAVASGRPAPTYDAAAKSCSNVACHGAYSGTFTYQTWDWGCDCPAENTVSYAGNGGTSPSWFTTGIGCAACHDNPPRNAVWHSGYHANQGPSSAVNQCQFCHPDATGTNGQGTAITNPALHANGIVEVAATFKSSCYNCH
jgi:hypothetical protein